MSFFSELKRRNVFRVGVAYLVISWLILQVVDVIAPILELPEWVSKRVLLFIALGFIPALVLAWIFELTPAGVKREKDVDRSQPVSRKTGQKLNRVIIAVLVLVILMMGAERIWLPDARNQGLAPLTDTASAPRQGLPPADGAASTDKSIAILPFVNRSAAGENTQFFSDGIHDDLLTNLSKIHELKVISRTSVMAYRDTTKNMRQIGAELGVTNLLEGGVQQSGDRVRINVQLINALTDEHLWAETYDHTISAETLFEIQGEIARAIAVALEATLTAEEEIIIGATPTTNLDAYRAVLLSRQFDSRSGFDAVQKAINYARTANQLDPGYIDAYIALASALESSVSNGISSVGEVSAELSSAIDKAIELNPEYGPAWAVLGTYQFLTGDPEAEASFVKALHLDPGNSKTLMQFSTMLTRSGQPEKALPLLLQARDLDPLAQGTIFTLARTYESLGDFDQARTAYGRIREIDPESPLGYGPVAGTYFVEGRFGNAMSWLLKGLEVDPKDFEIAGWMVFSNDCLEDYAAAAEWSDWLDDWVTNQPQPMAMQAMHHYMTDRFEVALQFSNLALRLDLPDRWASDSIFMRIKRDEAIANGDPGAGIQVFANQHPRLLRDQPLVTGNNIVQATDLALLLQLAGRTDEADRLLETVIEAYEQPNFTTGADRFHVTAVKAEALALLGQEQAALEELRRIIDNGWRFAWRWETDLNPNFNGLRESDEFRGMISELEADMAQQRSQIQAMTDNGEIGPLPEKRTR
jgi:TolB-like protein/Tfp pilus assembly protein PilF